MPKGKVKGRDHSGDSGEWYPWTGTYKVDGKKVLMKIGKTTYTFNVEPCDLGSVCLVREQGGYYYSR
jgi:hypothetical protein